jgi:hypothetical protein
VSWRGLPKFAQDGLRWLAVLLIATVIANGELAAWHALRGSVGAFLATLVFAVVLVVLSSAATAAFGSIRLPGGAVLYRAAYPIRMVPYRLRELVARGASGSGKGNRQYATLKDFEAEDGRRASDPQVETPRSPPPRSAAAEEARASAAGCP